MTDLNIQGVIVDPQHDFCDPSGSLYVLGAEDDMVRLGSICDCKTVVAIQALDRALSNGELDLG